MSRPVGSPEEPTVEFMPLPKSYRDRASAEAYWTRIFELLAERPGEWGRIARQRSSGMAAYARRQVERRGVPVEVTARRVEGSTNRVDVYARWTEEP